MSGNRWAERVFAALFLFGILTGIACADTCMERHESTDLLGSDYSSEIPIASASPEECAQLCLADSRCKAATYMVPNGRYGSVAKCWLKDGVPALTADSLCSSWIKKTTPAFKAGFDASSVSAIAGFEVRFTDRTPGAATWSWDFGDGTLPATLQNPTHVYTKAGTYTVILDVTGTSTCGDALSDTATKRGYIAVMAPQNAGNLTMTRYDQADLQGLDYRGMIEIPSKDPGDCAQICLNDPECRAATYMGPGGVYGPVAYCWLKNAVPNRSYDATTISWIKEFAPTGSISISSVPAGASIYIDGRQNGTTPATISGVQAGTHSIRLTSAGYEDYTGDVMVTDGGTATVVQALVALPDVVTTIPASVTTTAQPVSSTPETNNEHGHGIAVSSGLLLIIGAGLLVVLIIAAILGYLWTRNNIVMQPLKREIPGDGKSTLPVRVRFVNGFGSGRRQSQSRHIHFETTAGTISDITIPAGQDAAEAILTSSKESGTVRIAAITEDGISATGDVRFTAEEASIEIQITPSEMLADGRSAATIIVKIKDRNGTDLAFLDEKIIGLSATLGSVPAAVRIEPKTTSGTATIVSGDTKGTALIRAWTGSVMGEVTIQIREPARRYCMHCGTSMNMEASFCPNCGQIPPSGSDTKPCSTCGGILPKPAKFCDKCGARQPV